MKKRTKKYNPNKHSCSMVKIQAALFSASAQETTEDDQNVLVLPVYAAITKFTNGVAETDDFVRLVEMNTFGFQLGKLIHDAGDETTRHVVLPSRDVFEATSDALTALGDRNGKTGRLVFTGNELQQVRSMAHWVEQLCQVASRGMILQALIAAEKLVKSELTKERAKRETV